MQLLPIPCSRQDACGWSARPPSEDGNTRQCYHPDVIRPAKYDYMGQDFIAKGWGHLTGKSHEELQAADGSQLPWGSLVYLPMHTCTQDYLVSENMADKNGSFANTPQASLTGMVNGNITTILMQLDE